MSHIFSLSFLVGFSAVTLQLSFLAFSDVLDNGTLTYVSVGLGLSMAPVIRLVQKWKHAKSAYYLMESESGLTPFYQRQLNFPLLVFCSTFGFIGAISISNHIFASEAVRVEKFVVKAVGQKRVRYDMFDYVFISNDKFETSFNLGVNSRRSFNIGETVKVTLKTGLWGFYIVEDVKQEG
jgi:hypothetical protein